MISSLTLVSSAPPATTTIPETVGIISLTTTMSPEIMTGSFVIVVEVVVEPLPWFSLIYSSSLVA